MKKKKKQVSRKKNPLWKKIVGGLFLVGSLLIMGYPFLAEWIFENRQDSIVETYKSDTDKLPDEKIEEELKRARQYNKDLFERHVTVSDPFGAPEEDEKSDYMSLLNPQGTGCMGYVEIPCINVDLPIYHGTSEVVLENGAGHLKESSLPIGGENTHAILTGHTGLNRAKLFTDLTQLEIGDNFFLYVLKENLAYEVDQIKVVLPEDSSDLDIESGKDYCTLITCTPYGVNSHRLLVRGHRVPYTRDLKEKADAAKKEGPSEWKKQYRIALEYGAVTIVVLVGISEIFRKIKKRRKDRKES